MTRAALAAATAVVVSISLVYSCSSPSAPADAGGGRVADAGGDAADAHRKMAVDARTDGTADARGGTGEDAPVDVAADALTDAAPIGDAGAAPLDWHPGNYGLTTSFASDPSVRDYFLTGTHAGSFDGVEMIYPWTSCEPTMNSYQACFDAIDGDLAATPTGKHIILMLQYKAFVGDGGAADAVPGYLLGSGAWCEYPDGGPVCGQYSTPGAAIAMIWNPAVALRLQNWIAALGGRYAQEEKIAGIVLPETSTGANGAFSVTSVGYSPTGYIGAIEDNVLAVIKAFPTKPAFQYINFVPPPVSAESSTLELLGKWALKIPHAGLGCPDVGGNSSFHPPGYDTLINSTYQLYLPFNVAIEPMDYTSAYTAGLDATYAEATGLARNGGMAAQFVVWWHSEVGGNAFTIDDVAAYLLTHPNPNDAAPTY